MNGPQQSWHALLETGRLEEVVAQFQRAVAIHPGLTAAWDNLGRAQQLAVQQGNLGLAQRPDQQLKASSAGQAAERHPSDEPGAPAGH